MEEVGRRDKDRDGGGRWALRCDVISWKLLCVVMLHPAEALKCTASYWLRKTPHDECVATLHLAAVFPQHQRAFVL